MNANASKGILWPVCLLGIVLLMVSSCGNPDQAQVLPQKVDFNYHIKPILSDRCFACHGPDENTREAELALHTQEGLFNLLDSAESLYVVRPGDPDHSALFQRIISHDPDFQMPPPAANLSVSEYEIDLIARWIDQGAEWKKHWSFIPPGDVSVPDIAKKDFVINEIDQFVLQKQREHKLRPSETELPEKLLRRVYFDLIGLPPPVEILESFTQNPSDSAYEAVVDQLLENPKYGERMASVWLDVARYADSHGYQDDRPRTVWPWRDWVIDAFNENLSYRDFATWQIAGDLLPDAQYRQKLATTFNRNHAITQEGGVINEEYLTEYAADRVQTFSTAFLGLTMQCARCHDHKYDPLSQEEYYEMLGFFNNVKDERGQISYFDLAPKPNLILQDSGYIRDMQAVREYIDQLDNEVAGLPDTEREYFESWKSKPPPYDPGVIQPYLLVDADLNDTIGWTFHNKVQRDHPGKVNVNLPPTIERPERHTDSHGIRSLSFNGKNFLTFGELGDFEYYDDFTLGARIMHTGQHQKTATFLSRRNGEQKRQGYDLSINPSNQVTFRLIHNMNDEYIQVTTTTRIPGGVWKTVYASYDGSGKASGITIFFDGNPQPAYIQQDSLHEKSILNGNDFIIGNWNHRARELSELYGFKGGYTDDVKLYDKQLSTLDIKHLSDTNTQPSFSDSEWMDHYLKHYSIVAGDLKNKLDSLRSIDRSIPNIPIMEERDTINQTYLLARGQYDAYVRPVSRDVPVAIMELEDADSINRLDLANWLFSDKHPLTSRVMINRLWQLYFGQGLVSTPEDFGNQGNLPSHPELLDWLSVRYRESGWDTKAMLKLIVMSGTYRQSSRITEAKRRKDPDNIYLARGPRKTLTAEMIRDQALYTSGLLYEKIGGKWVKPYQPAGIWKEMANQIGENKYRQSKGRDLYRRSLYTYWKRTIPPPTMLTFDAPERTVCTVKRQETSTPLQALILLNDPIYLEASRVLAHSYLSNNSENSIEDILPTAWKKITSRSPKQIEVEKLYAYFLEMEDHYSENTLQAEELLNVGESQLKPVGATAKWAALTTAISTIYNLDESKHN